MNASMDVAKWPELPPLVWVLAMHILEEEKKIATSSNEAKP